MGKKSAVTVEPAPAQALANVVEDAVWELHQLLDTMNDGKSRFGSLDDPAVRMLHRRLDGMFNMLADTLAETAPAILGTVPRMPCGGVVVIETRG